MKQAQNDAGYRQTLQGCHYLLRAKLEETHEPAIAEEIADKTAEYAVTVYCRQLCQIMKQTNTVGPVTRMNAMDETLREIYARKRENIPEAQQLFGAMYYIYTTPEYAHLTDSNAFGEIADLFHAAANEACVEKKFTDYHRKTIDQVVHPLEYF